MNSNRSGANSIQPTQTSLKLDFLSQLSVNQQIIVRSIARSLAQRRDIKKPGALLVAIKRELHARVRRAWSEQEGNSYLASLATFNALSQPALVWAAEVLCAAGKAPAPVSSKKEAGK